jgi:hypothetical protein
MDTKVNGALIVVSVSLLTIAACGSASSPGERAATSARSPSAIAIEQPGTTSYMRSRVGTPDELSPLAPPEARNVCKIGDHWTCDVNGQTMVYNHASQRWEPGQK